MNENLCDGFMENHYLSAENPANSLLPCFCFHPPITLPNLIPLSISAPKPFKWCCDVLRLIVQSVCQLGFQFEENFCG